MSVCVYVCNPASGMCSTTKLLGDGVPTQISDYYIIRLRCLLLCNLRKTNTYAFPLPI